MRFLIAALLLALTSTGTKAGEMTAGDLQSLCSGADVEASTACRFYILGVVQGIEIGDGQSMDSSRHLVERKKTILCLAETSQKEMVGIVKDAVRRVLAAYPKDRELPATSSILAAMSAKYPCPQ
jgi:hypothetical protein